MEKTINKEVEELTEEEKSLAMLFAEIIVNNVLKELESRTEDEIISPK